MRIKLLVPFILLAISTVSGANDRIAIIFVHGFGGDQLISKTIKRAETEGGDLRRAAFGEYNAFYDAFTKFIENEEKTINAELYAYKYDSRHGSNVTGGKIFNELLLKANQSKPDHIHIITLSNGNLIVREAIVAAESEKLKEAYAKTSVYDISPILGGAADARGTLPGIFKRFHEIDPFGKHIKKLFSDENIVRYDAAIKERHRTYLVCGDPFTRGIWNYWTVDKKNPVRDAFNYISTAMQGSVWHVANKRWYVNYEKARGSGLEGSHVEYVLGDVESDSYCTFEDYRKGNIRVTKRLTKIKDKAFHMRNEERKARSVSGYFAEKLSDDISDYAIDKFHEVFTLDNPYRKKIDSSINEKEGKFTSYNERHTILVYYMPLIERIGKLVFGSEFRAK